MAIFEEVTLEWRGERLILAPDRLMKAIAIVEEQITVAELSEQQRSGRYRHAQLSSAYAALLRYAGARVTDEEVYEALFPLTKEGQIEQGRAASACFTLLLLMVPPAALKARAPAGGSGAAVGKPTAGTAAL